MTLKDIISKFYNVPMYVMDEELNKSFEYLTNMGINNYRNRSKANIDDVKKYDREFFDEYIPLHNIYTKNKNGELYETNPFDIVVFGKDLYDTYTAPIIKGKKIKGFEEINMSKSTMLSYGNLGHEITHTQVAKDFNNISNIVNNEMLSIFMEFVIASTKGEETLNNQVRDRFRGLYDGLKDMKDNRTLMNSIDPYEQDIIKYISSTLKALHLYDIYINSSNQRKIEILSLIEDIFKRKLTVEKLLGKMNVTYTNSNDFQLIKEYVKKTN